MRAWSNWLKSFIIGCEIFLHSQQPPRLGILCAESPGGGREGDTAQGWVVKQQTGVNRGPVGVGSIGLKVWLIGQTF